MSNVTLKSPLKVSPLIKFTRWTMLLSGIYYGVKKKSYLTRSEKLLKVIREREYEESRKRLKIESEEKLKVVVRDLLKNLEIVKPK